MTHLPKAFMLGVTRIEELGRDYRAQSAPGFDWMQLLWFLIPILSIWFIVVIHRRSEQTSSQLARADGLLAELYQAHGFSAGDCSLCNKIADTCELSDPALLLASPTLFEKAVAIASQKSKFSHRQRETLEGIRNRLFAAQ